MKKLIAVGVVAVFAALLCDAAFSQEEPRPRRPRAEGEVSRPAPLTEEQRAEMRKAMERLRELNVLLREATAKARNNEDVRKAFEDVRAKQEALRAAQQKADEALEAALGKEVEGKPDLAKALEERKKLQEKFRELRGRFPGRAAGGVGAAAGVSRPRPEGKRP